MHTVFPPVEPVLIPVAGSDAAFPVHRIYCVGRNYADHAREMGADPSREPPFFFAKPQDAAVPLGGDVPFPPETENYQHEVELVIAIGQGGRNIPVVSALAHIYGYAVGIDFTRRDLQAAAKEKGHPWELGKAQDHGAPISAIHPAARIGHPGAGGIWLRVNGVEKQRGDLSQVIWNNAEVVAYLSRYFELKAGDLIFTGTPAGVSRVHRGDRIECGVDGVDSLNVTLV